MILKYALFIGIIAFCTYEVISLIKVIKKTRSKNKNIDTENKE